jgi:hypothetical protein
MIAFDACVKQEKAPGSGSGCQWPDIVDRAHKGMKNAVESKRVACCFKLLRLALETTVCALLKHRSSLLIVFLQPFRDEVEQAHSDWKAFKDGKVKASQTRTRKISAQAAANKIAYQAISGSEEALPLESSDDEDDAVDLNDEKSEHDRQHDRQGGDDDSLLDDVDPAVSESEDGREDMNDLGGRPALAELNAIDEAEEARMHPGQPTQRQPKKRGRGKAKRKYDSSALLASPKTATMSIEDGTCPFLCFVLLQLGR